MHVTEFERIANERKSGKPRPVEIRVQRYERIFVSAYNYMMGKPEKPDASDDLSKEVFEACKADKQSMFFGMPVDEPRLKRIFRICYDLLDKYKDGVPDSAYEQAEIYRYWKAKFNKDTDRDDRLAGSMFGACLGELQRQYRGQI